MAKYFDESVWSKHLAYPDWYSYLRPEYLRLKKQLVALSPSEQSHLKDELYSFFERALADKKVTLASAGPNLDEERKPIDTVVIHHTHHPGGMTKERLSAIHLVRLYTGYETTVDRKEGEAIWSNHFDTSGRQVFYSYHWFVHQDGSVEKLLNDSEVGWHAGNWNVNCRSVGICVDDNLDEKMPGDAVIESVRKIIVAHYDHVAKKNILGHREVNPKTTCPGNTFLNGWKDRVIAIS